ncbi:Di-heme cytochrome c peroxidase [Turneriella parva DSM 21527]|uniref:Di-heme cytochrome c peroxidase n=2 Tax=Turneriella TaxID=338321 RepID=I4B664_TURPD|nr:Di-heme cytochrome c peroxidase [Turneriella parva DSM 21527]
MRRILIILVVAAGFSCAGQNGDIDTIQQLPPIGRLTPNLTNPGNYANQTVPAYITKVDNSNPVTDAGAFLGRILFYDRLLSANNSTSCSSCHHQNLAFSDAPRASRGANGPTSRHSMRLVNVRFANDTRFFWDKRAASLEEQTTMPIRDHAEMGFSGANGDPDISVLLDRMRATPYYANLFRDAFGTSEITEQRLQLALGQFIRSIQSFDSRFDQGRAQVTDDFSDFPNFSTQENLGKSLFMQQPFGLGPSGRTGGGLGCNQCHVAPEFDISSVGNNGAIGAIGGGNDFNATRSPTLRDLVNANGNANGPMMHDGSHATLDAMVDHYNAIPAAFNPQLDFRLQLSGFPQRLNMTADEKAALIAFLKTLTGNAIYTDTRWSNPFGPPPGR